MEKTVKLMRIDFESKPVFDDEYKYVKTKTKIWKEILITNFHNKKMPKEKSPCKCLLIIMLNSIIKGNKMYYPQTLLEECKYTQENTEIENHIDDDLEKCDSNNETESLLGFYPISLFKWNKYMDLILYN